MPKLRMMPLGGKRRRAIAIWLTLALLACITVLTLLPLTVPSSVKGSDKVHHILAFTGLTLPSAVFYPKALLRVMVVAVVYGAGIEIIQPYVGRASELADFIADLVGIGRGATTGWFLRMSHSSRLANLRILRGSANFDID